MWRKGLIDWRSSQRILILLVVAIFGGVGVGDAQETSNKSEKAVDYQPGDLNL